MNRHPAVRLLESRRLVAGRVFDVLEEAIELPSGLRQTLMVVEHSGAVAVAALYENGDVLLVRQYRHAVGAWLLEIPAGRVEPGETPQQAARRELEEEAGVRAGRLGLLGCFYPAAGFCSERMTLFVARELTPAGAERAAMDADEELETLRLPLREALIAVREDAKSWIALMRVANGLATEVER